MLTDPHSALPSSIPLPGLIREPIQLAGAWVEGRDPGVWLGSVTGAVKLCGISFLVHGSEVSWAKGERASPGECSVSLHLGWYDKDASDVAVGFSVGGGGARWSTKLSCRPDIPEVRHLITGTILRLFDVPGSAPLSCYAAFFCGEETEVGRNGLWRVKAAYSASLPAPLDRVLTYGRSGRLDAATLLSAGAPHAAGARKP